MDIENYSNEEIRSRRQRRKEKTNLILVDDLPIIGEGLKSLLSHSPNLTLLNHFRNGPELFNSKSLKSCEILILEIALPDIDGFSIIEEAKTKYPNVKVLVYTENRNVEFYQKSITLGASGYVLKTEETYVLISAIKNLILGKLAVSPELSPSIDKAGDMGNYKSLLQVLTPREKEVLSLLAKGLTSLQISQTLKIKKETADKHRENIRNKIRGKITTIELAIMVKKYGLL